MLSFVFLIMMFSSSFCQISGLDNSCSLYQTCSSCIQAADGCYWCLSLNFSSPRCLHVASQGDKCPDADKEDPKSSLNITKKEELSEKVQVTPTEIEATLTPGYVETFNITVRPAANYPLDIYFLMDFSASTTDDLATMKLLATDIANTVANITSNFQLGFGTFVDKVVPPYVLFFHDLRYLDFYCYFGFDECVYPYSFKHSLSLTNNSEDFTKTILNASNSFNHDYPEGGFDGLLQVMECSDIIGWRDEARHIVIFLTDAGFHYAYDGLVGGIVRPNDGKCHLENKDPPIYYNLYDYYDYPSVAQIYTSMNLTLVLPGSSAVELNNDSSNIIDIISEEYAKTSQTIRLVYDIIPGLNITVVNRECPQGSTPDLEDPSICHHVLYNQTVVYTVSIEVTEVTQELVNAGKNGVPLRIPLYSDVVLKIQPVQNCSCDNTPVRGEAVCSGSGTRRCGECTCDEGFVGSTCGCSATAEPVCLSGQMGEMCSGHGECSCGVCICSKLTDTEYYYGKACECNNFNCPVDTHNRRCSGHGTCDCGKCICSRSLVSQQFYTGEICDCSPDTNGCINPQDLQREICGGHGQCVCETCQCFEGFFGDYCEPRLDETTCRIFRSCLECMLTVEDGNVTVSNVGCNDTCPVIIVTQDVMIEGTLQCRVTLSECYDIEYFALITGEGQDTVYVRSQYSDCNRQSMLTPNPTWQIAVPIAVVISAVGVIAILLVKLCIVGKDAYNYSQWKKNRAQEHHTTMQNPLYMHRAIWDTLPGVGGDIYIDGNQTFNPIFDGDEDYLEDDIGFVFENEGAD